MRVLQVTLVVVFCGLLGMALVAAKPQERVLAPPQQDDSVEVDRMVDMQSRISCYYHKPSKTFDCEPWGFPQGVSR